MYRYRNNCPYNNQNQVTNNSNTANSAADDSKCACGFADDSNAVFPTNFMFGQSYVPIQTMNETFKPEVALKIGTLFPELVSPYVPCQSMAENAYLRRKTASIGQCRENAN